MSDPVVIVAKGVQGQRGRGKGGQAQTGCKQGGKGGQAQTGCKQCTLSGTWPVPIWFRSPSGSDSGKGSAGTKRGGQSGTGTNGLQAMHLVRNLACPRSPPFSMACPRSPSPFSIWFRPNWACPRSRPLSPFSPPTKTGFQRKHRSDTKCEATACRSTERISGCHCVFLR